MTGGELEVNHYDSSCGFLRTYFADRHIENISAELETGNRRILIQDGGGKEDQLGEKLEDGAELVLKNEVDEEKVEVVKTGQYLVVLSYCMTRCISTRYWCVQEVTEVLIKW